MSRRTRSMLAGLLGTAARGGSPGVRGAESAAGERLRFLIDACPLPLAHVVDGRFVSVNRAHVDLLGYTEEALRGQEARSIYGEGVLPGAGDSAHRGEHHVATRDGHELCCEVQAGPIDAASPAAGVAVALLDVTERAARTARLERTAEVGRLLESLATAASGSLDPASAISRSLREVCEYAGWTIGHAALVRREGDEAITVGNFWHADDLTRYADFVTTSEGFHHSLHRGVFVSRVMRTREVVLVRDLATTLGFGRIKALVNAGLRSGLAVPVIGQDGEVTGFVEFFSVKPMDSDDELLAAIGRVGEQLGRVAERIEAERRVQQLNAELEQRVKERTAELESANRMLEVRNREVRLTGEMVALMQACTSVEESTAVIERFTRRLFPECRGGVYLIRESTNFLELLAGWGDPLPAPTFATDACWALRRGQAHCVGDVAQDLCCPHVDEAATSTICYPMMAGGHALGILYLAWTAPVSVPGGGLASRWSDDQKLAASVAEQLALALANLRLRETLRNQSVRDGLTGLFNRRYLEETLEREIARAQRMRAMITVLMIDVDHFKRFNDQHGHQAGDSALRALGRALKGISRVSDVPCRYGGEEFTVVLTDTTLEAGCRWGERLLAAIHRLEVATADSELLRFTVSIGAAAYPEHGDTAESLIERADAALYRAKDEGRDRLVAAA